MKRNSRAVGWPVVGLVRIFFARCPVRHFWFVVSSDKLGYELPADFIQEERWVAPKALSAEGKHFLTSARVE
jgi:hypothetical protein